ncbi:hypothetical protein EDC61_11423 [Sulfuritortus calidifontis]|uniref:Uncharacterized protein n=1 Tax=Sulfuritortus calidifontis TaxID=1914471 RepID=A0A4R3JVJ3_9PROT|nr:hypothetical protein [Sulfuritortus calidifontis]TCS70696.1 hypothetical protein EDC61_11423 [Sulfuritortus calidifontis]
MMLGRCPVCHSHLSLEAIVQDDAARELLGVLSALDATLSRALVGYLGLWRPAKQDLRWDRALRLAREALALSDDAARLALALSETTEAIRAKGGATPIKSHGYLKRVLEGAPQAAGAVMVAQPAPHASQRVDRIKAPSATVDGVMRLEALKRRARGEVGHE